MVLPVPIVSAPISISHLRLDLTAGCRDLREEMLLRGGRWPLLSLSPSQPHRDMRAMSDHLLKVLSSLPPILGCVLALANWPALEFPFFLAVHCPRAPATEAMLFALVHFGPRGQLLLSDPGWNTGHMPHWPRSCFPQLSPSVLSAELPADYGPSVCSSASLS